MPRYFFTAKSQKGELLTGTREAKDQYELARTLRQEGYFLVSAIIEEVKKRPWELTLPFFGGVSLKEKMVFTRNLQVMIGAGVSLPRALRTLAFQSQNRKLRKTLEEITEQVIKGKNFSEALTEYPDIFSELFCSIIKVGEEAGTLEENLGLLIRQMEREYELRSKIKGAMVYPAVIIVAMIGIGILMLIMVVPQLAQTFEELGVELPLTTKAVIALGTFLAEKWYLAILIIIIFMFFLRLILKTREGKKIWDRFALKIPIISSIVQKTNSAYTVRILSSLIASGVSLVRSLEITSTTLGNIYFKEALANSVERVKKGEKLSETLKSYPHLYPPLVTQMIEVGEETGQTSDILQKLADFFEEEVTNATKNLAAVIEPVLMLLIGATVGFFAISMIQPMYAMLGAL